MPDEQRLEAFFKPMAVTVEVPNRGFSEDPVKRRAQTRQGCLWIDH